MLDWQFFFALFAGVTLFLYAMEQFSTEIRVVAGKRFRQVLQQFTRTRFHGVILGFLVTGLIQSSTATTVITVGLVNAGILSFVGSLGIIFGANVGTTITAQLVAFNLTAIAPVFIVLGFLITLVGGKYRVLGRPVFFFGLVFFSLEMISDVIAPYQYDPAITGLLASLDNPILLILAGFILTTIFQSSSVTVGLIVIMSLNGIINPVEGIPILLGANLGSPTTALLVSLRMNNAAKRTAMAHFLFSFIGVLIFLPFLGPFTTYINELGGSAAQQIANAHLLFNLICTIIFLILLHPFAALVRFLVPSSEDELVYAPRYLTSSPPADMAVACQQISDEIGHLIRQSDEILSHILNSRVIKPEQCRRITQVHEYAIYLEDAIQQGILALSHRELSPDAANRLAIYSRMAEHGRLLSDQALYLAEKLKKGQDSPSSLSEASYEGYVEVCSLVHQNLATLLGAFPHLDDATNRAMRERDEQLRTALTSQYKAHLHRMMMHQSPGGSKLSELLSSVEIVGATVRELRKTIRAMQRDGFMSQ